MKKRQTEEQILGILLEAGKAKALPDLLRGHNIATGTFYRWRSKYCDMQNSQLRRLKELEREIERLKRLVVEQALDIVILKDVDSKNW